MGCTSSYFSFCVLMISWYKDKESYQLQQSNIGPMGCLWIVCVERQHPDRQAQECMAVAGILLVSACNKIFIGGTSVLSLQKLADAASYLILCWHGVKLVIIPYQIKNLE